MWVFFGHRKYNISIELWSKVENPYIRTQFFFLNANNKKTVIRFNVTTIFFSNIECLIYFFECLKDFFIDSIVNIQSCKYLLCSYWVYLWIQIGFWHRKPPEPQPQWSEWSLLLPPLQPRNQRFLICKVN